MLVVDPLDSVSPTTWIPSVPSSRCLPGPKASRRGRVTEPSELSKKYRRTRIGAKGRNSVRKEVRSHRYRSLIR